MNTKNLIIAFITVSVAALIVSAFAVFAVARSQYETLLASATEAEDIRTEEVVKTPETPSSPETSSKPETSSVPQTTSEITEATESETLHTETEAPAESSEVISSNTGESTSVPSGYTVKLEGDRLVVRTPDGEPVCERIINAASIHPKDREHLQKGISFSDESAAMSAVYDIIS